MATLSALERVKKLDAERDKILAEAKEEALGKAREAVAELNSLGFNYDITSGGKKSKGTRQSKAGACLICEFETLPHHDGRQHRSQGKHKKAFTAADLSQMGMTKV